MASSSSSATLMVADVEAQQRPASRASHFSILLDPAGLDDEALNRRYAGAGTAESPYLVDFLPSDPRNPMTFSRTLKWLVTLLAAVSTLAVSFASSAYSGGLFNIMRDFDVSTEVAVIGVSMFVLGFAVGPLIWAPLSELYGRQKLFFFTYLALAAFGAGAAVAPNMAALIVLRFFAGAFGSSPLTNAGGVIADMFSANERGIATAIFAMAPFLGPALGPIAGGFLGEAKGWRWVEGMTAIFTGVLWILNSVVYPETYAPVLLRRRAAALSEKTGKVYISKLDAGRPETSIGSQFRTALSRPWILLFKEPIVFLTSIYMAIIYGTLYLCFAAFPIVFQLHRGWRPGVGGLAFVGIAVGMMVSAVGVMFDNKRYQRVAAESGGNAPPEARLPPALIGSILLPVGLFWFAWTNGDDVHWVVPIIGSSLFGAGIVLEFLSLMNYLIDSYVVFAASVLAANSILRSLFGAIFPLFTAYMYHDLGIHWASSVPAFLALVCVPFPFLFYKYGAGIRAKCQYAAEAAHILEMMRSKRADAAADETVAEAAEAVAETEETEKGGRHGGAAVPPPSSQPST
ncbi:MFS-type transporter [Tolypocladium capitatum]|uniref:MFS-type transporter n=1 Tax=Tolypocladium capitatum TaxID=45235 RepID=A0A2K3Q974_9HYPO|nr:MFS-type transporter [Tolypocladium capitatum]